MALAARKVAYGENIEHSGLLYRRHPIRDGRVTLEFDHVGRGLVVGRQGGELRGFVIASADHPDRANLYNREGLPAAPFRTDGWPHEPRGK